MRLPAFALALLCGVALTSARAHADDVADEADLKFRLGAEAYQRGDFRTALEQFLASNRLVPNRNVTFNVARCYQELRQFPEAYRYFVLSLRDETNADARARIERELTQIRKNVAVLEVESDPAGATVYVERRDLGARGNTPTALGLKPGAYLVLVELPGYYPARAEVEPIAAGRTERVRLKLEPILGQVQIDEAARGASVRVDSSEAAVACVAPCTLDLSEGRHSLFFERPGYEPARFEVEVRAKQKSALHAPLVPLTGSVVISSDEPGALVEVDGRPRGFTPLVVPLQVGEHELRLSLGGYKPVLRRVVVQKGRETRVDVMLTQSEEVTAASRSTEGVDDAPSSVSIVPQRELAAMRYPTLVEALRGLPGVYSWNDRSYQAVGFRGLGRLGSYGNRVLVLVDGHPLNDNWLGSSYVGYDARVGLDDVERIEVVRGPGSVLYGTNAFSGVVNVVTRKPSVNGGEIGISTAESGVGRGRARANVAIPGGGGLWASASVARGQGRDFFFPELDASSRGADGFNAGTLEGRLYRGPWSAAWYLQSHHKQLPTGAYETVLADPRTEQTDARGSLELKAEPRWSDALSSMTRLHANHYRFDGGYARPPADDGLETDTFRGTWLGLEQRIELTPNDFIKLTLGGEGQLHVQVNEQARDDAGSFLDDEHPYQVGAAYALVDLTANERLHLSVGARLDAYSTFGRSLSPRAALVAKLYPAGNSKLMFGKAFRAPSVYELYYNDGGRTQVQSPDLSPESIYSLELEHAHRFSPTVSATFATFVNWARDLVLTEGEGDDIDPLRYVNAGAPVGTIGAEFGLRRDWRQGYMLALSYSFQRSRFLSSPSLSSLVGFEQSPDFRRVANSPEHLASVKGALPLLGRSVALASRLSFEGARYDRNEQQSDAPQSKLPVFAVWDVVLTGRAERHGFSWAAGVYNAFDWRYQLPVSAEFPQRAIEQDGRSFLLSADLAF